jgi:hypothetical protein
LYSDVVSSKLHILNSDGYIQIRYLSCLIQAPFLFMYPMFDRVLDLKLGFGRMMILPSY